MKTPNKVRANPRAARPAKAAPKNGRAGGGSALRIPERWAWHFRALTRLQERLLAQRRAFLGEAAEPIEPHGMHQADSATDEFDHEFALSQLSTAHETIKEVDAAIRRILDGTYGVCKLTGKRIPAARLEAVPWTRYCTDAEAGLEKAGNVPRP